MSRVELFERIRRDARLEEMGVRALARKHGIHRRTVRQALMSAVPPERKHSEPAAPMLGPWKPLIRTWVTADQVLPKKQRHTARPMLAAAGRRLRRRAGRVDRQRYVAQLRRKLTGGVAYVTVPQVHRVGEEAEVDFGELWVWLDGTLTKVWRRSPWVNASPPMDLDLVAGGGYGFVGAVGGRAGRGLAAVAAG